MASLDNGDCETTSRVGEQKQPQDERSGTFPPGNSQSPAMAFPSGLCAKRIRPLESIIATALTNTTRKCAVVASAPAADIRTDLCSVAGRVGGRLVQADGDCWNEPAKASDRAPVFDLVCVGGGGGGGGGGSAGMQDKLAPV